MLALLIFPKMFSYCYFYHFRNSLYSICFRFRICSFDTMCIFWSAILTWQIIPNIVPINILNNRNIPLLFLRPGTIVDLLADIKKCKVTDHSSSQSNSTSVISSALHIDTSLSACGLICFFRQSLIVLVAIPVLLDSSVWLICNSSSLANIFSYIFMAQYPFPNLPVSDFSDIVSWIISFINTLTVL